MTIQEIMQLPTCVRNITPGLSGVHESTLRSYQILQRVKEYLREDYPANAILELVQVMESAAEPKAEA